MLVEREARVAAGHRRGCLVTDDPARPGSAAIEAHGGEHAAVSRPRCDVRDDDDVLRVRGVHRHGCLGLVPVALAHVDVRGDGGRTVRGLGRGGRRDERSSEDRHRRDDERHSREPCRSRGPAVHGRRARSGSNACDPHGLPPLPAQRFADPIPTRSAGASRVQEGEWRAGAWVQSLVGGRGRILSTRVIRHFHFNIAHQLPTSVSRSSMIALAMVIRAASSAVTSHLIWS